MASTVDATPTPAGTLPSAANGSGRGRSDGNPRGRGRGRGGGGGGGGSSNGGGGGRGQGNARSGASGRSQRERGGRGGHSQAAAAVLPQPANVSPETQLSTATVLPASKSSAAAGGEEAEDDDDDVEAEVCFICASPVVHQAVTPCNHRTCHICALRMRALYKIKECAHCRTVAPYVVFTDDATKRFEDYTDADVSSRDENIGIRYANEDIVGDTVLLLRYNCPDNSCDFAGLGWPDLHRHVRTVHHKKMCDLCTRNKKVFTHEHELFTEKELGEHMRRGDDIPGAIDQTGFKGHPLCAFCGQRFYDDDKLYEHCRERHERCFLCDRENPRQPHYYRDYNSLEEHFRKDHYLCADRECLEKKFVVFGSDVDLKAHQLSEHAGSLSKDMRRDARSVNLARFDFRQPYEEPRRGGGGGGAATTTGPSDRRGAGGGSSTAAPPPSAAVAPPTSEMEGLSLTDPNLTPEDRARLLRHSAVIERASNLLQNDRAKIDAFRTQISGYRQSKTTAPALVEALFSLFSEASSTALGTLIREVADLFEDRGKVDALRKAWNDWRAVNEDYPTLPGLGGMRGATTASSGWASAAASNTYPTAAVQANSNNSVPGSQRHTTRVLKLKNSTQQSRRSSVETGTWGGAVGGGGGSGSGRSTPAARSAAPTPAPASLAFPALPSSGGGGNKKNNGSSSASAALWGSSGGSGGGSSSSSNGRVITQSQSQSQSQPRPAPRATNGARGEDAFPALPAAPKPTTSILGYGSGNLRRDLGGNRDTGFSWSGSSSSGGQQQQQQQQQMGEEEDGEGAGGGKGKKGNKGRKKVLVQWG
ncbi:putative zinc finger protein [Eutypa lata UCREL1]|uniref:RING-type E3 ubiquitin transferase n=1 Tax=Eutypa lata (strain UCR-EL1) TaxID=1287681 RepID=M7SS95_EUTLA|nr:putative zinc finger protein [Eutypa lata UCREL1]